jgi:hypothetical protein
VTGDETFRQSWRGRVHSSQGYSVRIAGRTGLDYRDSKGKLRIDSEVMAGPEWEVVVYTQSIPDTPERPRSEVLDRLRRAFDFAGWRLILEDAWVE